MVSIFVRFRVSVPLIIFPRRSIRATPRIVCLLDLHVCRVGIVGLIILHWIWFVDYTCFDSCRVRRLLPLIAKHGELLLGQVSCWIWQVFVAPLSRSASFSFFTKAHTTCVCSLLGCPFRSTRFDWGRPAWGSRVRNTTSIFVKIALQGSLSRSFAPLSRTSFAPRTTFWEFGRSFGVKERVLRMSTVFLSSLGGPFRLSFPLFDVLMDVLNRRLLSQFWLCCHIVVALNYQHVRGSF